jgi:hypothetical protein
LDAVGPGADRAARRRRRRWPRLLLCAGTTLLLLAAAELAMRAVDGYLLFATPLRLDARSGVPGAELAHDRAFQGDFLRRQAAARPDLDPRWFLVSPPPVPRHAVRPELEQRFASFDKVFLYELDEPLLRAAWVRGKGLAFLPGLAHPDSFFVFTPPDGGIAPGYRYPASTTLPTGLTTNAFGFRGRELAVDKPPGVVRIACVGASTTIGGHDISHSWPELLEGFLGEWARRERLPVGFEVLNAGCEGYVSADIRATVRHYVLPLAVDYVVYYEGANQFHAADLLRHVRVHGDATRPMDLLPLVADATAPSWFARLADRSALARRLRSLLRARGPLREPEKPAQEIALPQGLDANAVDLARAGEVLALQAICSDLAAIRADVGAAGGRLVVCSFRWLVHDGLVLDGPYGELVWRHLNADLWPCTYATVRALVDLQNRWFEVWAAANDADFLDVAAAVPQDERLHTDAIHSTPLGSRCQAWVTFAGLTRLVARDLAAGRIPVPDRHPDAVHPSIGPVRVVTRAELDAAGH